MERYLFSGGASNRDFTTLANAAKDTEIPVIVACTKKTANDIQWPKNVQVRTDAYGPTFYRLIEQSSGVIITLADPTISSGQIVLLMAMRAGKPIVVTASAGVNDYIDDSCAWLVPPHDVAALQGVLSKLVANDKEVLAKALRGQERYLTKFTVHHFGQRIGEHLKPGHLPEY